MEFKCNEVQMVDINKIRANDYNPNFVSSVNMELLKTSVDQNGFCYPVIVIKDEKKDDYVIIDGYHRYSILKGHYKAKECPVIVLDHAINERMTFGTFPLAM